MVMAVQPSPQSVGREFVRQYYTLLNKAPEHMHRFYNTNSSFVHGGFDAHNREAVMVTGQKQIFAKIKQLKFRDCHAKISQVDAQSTLGNGVVVQVSGELSNDGQPMRRFMQTFVLAMQTPKKYYVHNDIFRYQDLYSEDEAELENGGGQALNGEPEPTAPVLQQQQVELQQQQQQQQPPQLDNVQLDGAHQQPQGQLYYPVNETGISLQAGSFVQLNGSSGSVAKQDALQQQQQQQHHQQQQQQQQQQQHLAQQQLHQQHHQQQQQHHHQQQQQQHQQQQQQAEVDAAAVAAAQLAINSEAATSAADNSNNNNTDSSYDRTTLNEQETDEQNVQQHSAISDAEAAAVAAAAQQQEELVPVVAAPAAQPAAAAAPAPAPKTIQPAEPKTYANLFKSDFSSAMATAPALGSSGGGQQTRYGLQRSEPQRPTNEQVNAGTRAAAASSSSAPAVSRPVRSQERRPSGAPAQQQQQSQQPPPSSQQSAQSGGPSAGQPQTHYPNNQQLFLGNVPPQATDDELRQLFGKYGTVIDLRINTKPGKLPGGRLPPNYGFITYDDPEAVQNCLAHMPLYYPENSPDGQKLNVEEKKPRNGPSAGPRGGNDDRGINRNIGGGNSGGGPRLGAPGMMRGPSIGGGNGGSSGPRGGAPGSGGPRGGAFNRNDQRGSPASGGAGGIGGGPQRAAGQTAGGAGGGGAANSNYGRR